MHKACANSSQTSCSTEKGGRHEVPALVKELLVIDSCRERESWFPECGPVTQQRSMEGYNALTEDHTATSLCGVQIELDGCKKNKRHKVVLIEIVRFNLGGTV